MRTSICTIVRPCRTCGLSWLGDGKLGPSYTYVVPLTDPDTHWCSVDPNLRRLIARCERDGVTYREDDDFDALFRLHDATRQRKGAPQYLPRERFARYFQ